MSKKYIISEEVAKSILAYLITKPYQEVVQGIQALQSLELLEEKEEIKKEEK